MLSEDPEDLDLLNVWVELGSGEGDWCWLGPAGSELVELDFLGRPRVAILLISLCNEEDLSPRSTITADGKGLHVHVGSPRLGGDARNMQGRLLQQ